MKKRIGIFLLALVMILSMSVIALGGPDPPIGGEPVIPYSICILCGTCNCPDQQPKAGV